MTETERFRLALETLRASARQQHSLEQARRERVALLRRIRLVRGL